MQATNNMTLNLTTMERLEQDLEMAIKNWKGMVLLDTNYGTKMPTSYEWRCLEGYSAALGKAFQKCNAHKYSRKA